MPTLDTRAGRLDVLVHPGNAHSLVFTWPAPLTSRTFTATLGTATALTVTVDGATVTVDFTEAQTAGVTTATWWKLTETTSGTQDRIVGKVIPNRYGTSEQDDEVAVVEDETTVTVTVLGEPGTGAGALADGDKGDITVSSSGTVWTIDNGAVTAAKVAADVATQAELDAVAATIPTTEAIQDLVGGMVTGGTETGIAVTYDDTNGRLDFVAEVTQAELDAVSGAIPSTEAIQDIVGAMATDGTTVNFTYNDGAGTLTAEVQGLTSANLSDFAEAVRDRLGSTLTAGTGITVTVDDPGDTVTIATTVTQYTDEMARDAIGTALVAGNNIDITVVDGSDTITVDVEGLTSADLSDFAEAVDDRVNSLLVAGTNITLTYDDVANTLTIDAGGGGGLTQEQAEDIVAALIDDNSDLDWTYDDGTASLVAVIKPGSVTNTMLAGSIALSKLATDPLARANHTGTQLLATISDVTASAAEVNVLDGVTASTAELNLLDGVTATTTELNYVDGVTSAIQTQLDAKLSKVAAGASVEDIGAIESNVNTVAATGATETLDTSVYGVFDCTMDQACTFTFSNPAPSGKATVFVLILRGAFTPTLPASVDWSSGSPPTYTTPSVYTFTTVDAGTTWLGAQVGKAFA